MQASLPLLLPFLLSKLEKTMRNWMKRSVRPMNYRFSFVKPNVNAPCELVSVSTDKFSVEVFGVLCGGHLLFFMFECLFIMDR